MNCRQSTAPTHGLWEHVTTMDRPRSHTPVAVSREKIYFFGGGGTDFLSLDDSATLDPKTSIIDRLAPMPSPRSGTVGCTVGDDRIFVIGGGFKQPDGRFRFLKTVEIFNTLKNTWQKGPDMLMPHDYPGGTFWQDYIYILGGHHPDATTSGPKTDPGFDFCERLHLPTDKWETIAPLPTPRFALTSIPYENKILAMGGVAFTPEGFNNFTVVEAYDPVSNQWSEEPHLTLPWPAAGHGTCLIGEHIFIFGGYSGDGIHARAAVFSPGDQKWLRLPDMPAPRCAMGVAVADNAIYLFGGWADDGRTPVDTVFRYLLP